MLRKRLVQGAGALNLLLGVLALFPGNRWLERIHGVNPSLQFTQTPTYFSGFYLLLALVGVMLLLAARDTGTYREIIGVGAVGKLVLFGFGLWGYWNGVLTNSGLGLIAINGLFFGIVLLFVTASPEPCHTEPSPSKRPTHSEPYDRIEPARGTTVDVLRWMTKKQFGQPLETLGIVGHHGGLLFGTSMMESAVDRFDALEDRLHSLISLRVAQIVGCPW